MSEFPKVRGEESRARKLARRVDRWSHTARGHVGARRAVHGFGAMASLTFALRAWAEQNWVSLGLQVVIFGINAYRLLVARSSAACSSRLFSARQSPSQDIGLRADASHGGSNGR